MNTTIIVDNLKCHGCANTITKALMKMKDVKNVSVDVESSKVNFAFEAGTTRTEVLTKLASLGYPEEGTGTAFQNAKSYVSCAIGRIS